MIIVYTLLRHRVIEFINVWGIINDKTHINDYYLLQSDQGSPTLFESLIFTW